MKKFYTLLICFFACFSSNAHDFIVDGIYYQIQKTNNTVTVTNRSNEYNSYSGRIEIPESVEYLDFTYQVSGISSYAFRDCTGLKEVIINAPIPEIPNSEFIYCTGLETVFINNSCPKIGDWAFEGCSSLQKCELKYGASSIGKEAFKDCEKLQSINFGNDLTSIGEHAFQHCNSLTKITIPASTQVIGEGAFNPCESLSELYIEDSENILQLQHRQNEGSWTFFSCPIENLYIGRDFTQYSGNSTFKMNNSLKKVVLGEFVTQITDSEFYKCENLSEITISDKVSIIGDNAFSGCVSLSEINFSENVSSIGQSAFRECTSLKTINLGKVVTSIENSTFYGCISLEEVKVPDSVIKIGEYAFYRCSNLKEISIGKGVKEIERNAFTSCTSLNTISIPANVDKIGFMAFDQCSSLSNLIIEDGITPLDFGIQNNGYEVFKNCPISNIYLGRNITYEKRSPFNGISTLTDLEISNYVTELGDSEFISCPNLTTVVLPESINSIGDYAFFGCEGIKDVYSYAIVPPIIQEKTFVDRPDKTLYVLKDSETLYKEAEYWKDFGIISTIGYIPVESIILEPSSADLITGEILQLVATVLPEEATDKTVVWSSSDTDILTVSENGLVTAISEGTAIITATCGEVSAECIINVIDDAGVESLLTDPESEISIYSTDGMLMKKGCKPEDLKTLNKGIYIIVSGDNRHKISI